MVVNASAGSVLQILSDDADSQSVPALLRLRKPTVWAITVGGSQRLGSPLDSGKREVNILYLERKMLKYAIIFALVSLVSGTLGFSGIAAGSAGIAKILFGLFLILAVVFIVLAALGVGAARKVLK